MKIVPKCFFSNYICTGILYKFLWYVLNVFRITLDKYNSKDRKEKIKQKKNQPNWADPTQLGRSSQAQANRAWARGRLLPGERTRDTLQYQWKPPSLSLPINTAIVSSRLQHRIYSKLNGQLIQGSYFAIVLS
jgi:hypothetical protein